MSSLNNAIQLIRQGRKEDARQILEPLIRAEPSNIQAWFWYVDICPTVERRIQVLEVCLKMNPSNSQVMQALQTLRNQRPAQASFAPLPAQSPKPAISQPPQSSSPNSAMYEDEPERPVPSSYTPAYFDNTPAYPPAVTSTAKQQSPGKQKNAWEEDPDSYVDTSMLSKLSKPKPIGRSYAFYEVWMAVLLTLDVEAYADVLNDPEAGTGRAFEWIAYSGIISGLIFPLSILINPQFAELMNMSELKGIFGNMGTTTFIIILTLAMTLLVPLFSVIGLAIGAAIQNLLAISFGGNGNYSRTVYALAAYIAPITILSTALGIIPAVGQCLTSLLGIYNIVLNVRALRASHSLSTGSAIGVMLAPTVIIFIFGCALILLVGLPNMSR
jgi:hypothetical protein